MEGGARPLSNRVSWVTKCPSNASASDEHKSMIKKVNGELVRAKGLGPYKKLMKGPTIFRTKPMLGKVED